MDEKTTFLEAALRYADLGYPVFPLRAGTKKPLTEHGFFDATTDPGQIERWWVESPAANVGLATNGLVVVGVDGAANRWLADEPERQLELPRAPTARTPRGGSHHLFRQPAGKGWRCTTGGLAPKVDTRADGGYLVLPPSVLRGGKAYRWVPGLEL